MDLAKTLKFDFYGHGGLISCFLGGARRSSSGDTTFGENLAGCRFGRIEGQPGGKTSVFCQMSNHARTTGHFSGPIALQCPECAAPEVGSWSVVWASVDPGLASTCTWGSGVKGGEGAAAVAGVKGVSHQVTPLGHTCSTRKL